MIVKMFKPQFVEAVKEGRKLQTVRPRPIRMPKVGDSISCREWTGRPYCSPQRELFSGTITRVARCEITNTGVILDSHAEPMDDFARKDGFEDFFEMRDWFLRTHGNLPFEGIAIFWESSSKCTSALNAAKSGEWPLRCELRKEPSKRLADYLE